MNRRQFLTGVSAAAVASALPAAFVAQPRAIEFATPEMLVAEWKARMNAAYAVTARAIAKNITAGSGVGGLHLAFPQPTSDWRSFCATGEELG